MSGQRQGSEGGRKFPKRVGRSGQRGGKRGDGAGEPRKGNCGRGRGVSNGQEKVRTAQGPER